MKEKITFASILLFEKNGFSETSIQNICDALGVTKGTFYYYFANKEELLMDIHKRYIDGALRRQAEILEDPSTNYRATLFDMIFMQLHAIDQQGASARVFFREIRHLGEERLAEIIPKRNQFRANLEMLLQKGVELGEFQKKLNVKIIALGILGLTNWSYQWFHPDGELNDREVTEVFVHMVLQGIER